MNDTYHSEIAEVFRAAAQLISSDAALSACQALYAASKDKAKPVSMQHTVHGIMRMFAPYGKDTDFVRGERPDSLMHTPLPVNMLWWNFRARTYKLEQEAVSNTDVNSDNEDPCASFSFLHSAAIAQVVEERMLFLLFIANYVETEETL